MMYNGCDLHLQFCSSICSVIYVECVYIAPVKIHASDFIYEIYIGINVSYLHVKCIAYLYRLWGIFVSDTYMAIMCKVDVVVGCTLEHVWKTIRYIGHAAQVQCNLCMQYTRHICSVIYFNNMKCGL